MTTKLKLPEGKVSQPKKQFTLSLNAAGLRLAAQGLPFQPEQVIQVFKTDSEGRRVFRRRRAAAYRVSLRQFRRQQAAAQTIIKANPELVALAKSTIKERSTSAISSLVTLIALDYVVGEKGRLTMERIVRQELDLPLNVGEEEPLDNEAVAA